jgi:hypothetical protein
MWSEELRRRYNRCHRRDWKVKTLPLMGSDDIDRDNSCSIFNFGNFGDFGNRGPYCAGEGRLRSTIVSKN